MLGFNGLITKKALQKVMWIPIEIGFPKLHAHFPVPSTTLQRKVSVKVWPANAGLPDIGSVFLLTDCKTSHFLYFQLTGFKTHGNYAFLETVSLVRRVYIFAKTY